MNMQQLKAANPIERVAARYGTLLRSGANYKMLCPFHDDHHPSLGIHADSISNAMPAGREAMWSDW